MQQLSIPKEGDTYIFMDHHQYKVKVVSVEDSMVTVESRYKEEPPRVFYVNLKAWSEIVDCWLSYA